MTLHVTKLASLTCDFRYCVDSAPSEPDGRVPPGWSQFSVFQYDTSGNPRRTNTVHFCEGHSGLAFNLKPEAWKRS